MHGRRGSLVVGRQPRIEPLAACLKDSDATVRSTAAEALGSLDDNLAIEPLAAYLKDSDFKVQCTAAEALGHFRDKRAFDSLVACLKGKDAGGVRPGGERAGGVRQARRRATSGRPERQRRQRSVPGGHRPRPIGRQARVEPLLAALKDKDASVRLTAPYALFMLGDECGSTAFWLP